MARQAYSPRHTRRSAVARFLYIHGPDVASYAMLCGALAVFSADFMLHDGFARYVVRSALALAGA